jgi:uncharacterized membrane protein HdeD (DUF308 family)
MFMGKKVQLITSLIQIVIGIAAVIAFFILLFSNESITRYIVIFILAIAFIIIGVINLIDYFKKR